MSTDRRYAAVAAPFGRDLERGFEAIASGLEQARRRGAELVAFPECALGGPPGLCERLADDPVPPALDRDGPELARLAALAPDLVVCAGFTERTSSGRYSTAACVHGGKILDLHRKVHIPPSELRTYCAGSSFHAFDTPVGRIGMLNCYDKVFPEAARSLALAGAETIVAMSAWPASRERPTGELADDTQSLHFDLMDQARAVENQVVWVSSNLSGGFGPLRFLGQAKVIDPDGHILSRTTPGSPGIAVGGVPSADLLKTTRRAISHLRDRRPPAYGPLPSYGVAIA
ncbi:MAG TPA: carbon-nitrogen hydrolase family protein [Solirubrobacterales bacterium]|nr:carbon-nitrogen hydrolase family protein [Solirubrobacterales bacterium]